MYNRVTILYNEPIVKRYGLHEAIAVTDVLKAVHLVENALHGLGFTVFSIPLVPPVDDLRNRLQSLHTDVVFNLFEGFDECSETEALVPEILEELHIPYTGCPGKALRISLDKARAKALMKSVGIATPGYQVLSPDTISNFILSYPCIVKPRREDASHGLSTNSVVFDFSSLERQISLISGSYGGDALVEEFIGGREFNATVIGNKEYLVLPVSEIVYDLPKDMPRVLTFDAKWNENSPYFIGTNAVCPANLTTPENQSIIDIVLKVARLFDCHGYARVDMRLDSNDKINVIEINPNPDISPGSGAIRQIEAAGMTYSKFIKRIVTLAMERSSWTQPVSIL